MTISFVSSGPGNPDLLTVQAVKRISDADIIFYDDLSAGEILNLAKKSATLLSVGKRAGLASPKQNQVSRLLVEYGRTCLLYTSPSPRDREKSRMPSSA